MMTARTFFASPAPSAAALGKTAVLMGGTSAEREVSLQSGAGVLAALQRLGVDAHAFDPAEQPLGRLKDAGFARCFIALHGRGGEDGAVQGALELLGLPYTGSGVMASAIAMDKTMTKRIWRFEGLPTPHWLAAGSAADVREALETLGAPLIVKPAREGSTIGLTKVTRAEQCEAAWQLASRHDAQVLCEQFIDGLETTIPILDVDGTPRVLPLIRIEAPGGNYDYQNKYVSNDTRYHCPADVGAQLQQRIGEIALKAFTVLGCRGWARADVMVRKSDGQPFLLEINTAPGMTGHSLVPMSAAAVGIGYDELCLRIAAAARLDAPAPTLSQAACH